MCGECIAQGSPRDPEGLLCKECAAAGVDEEPAAPAPNAHPPKRSRDRRRYAPLAAWIAFGLLLFLLFVTILYYPLFRTNQLTERLASDEPGVAADAADALVRMGGRTARQALARVARTGSTLAARTRAVDALGRLPGPETAQVLQQIADDPKTPAALRLRAQDALARQQRFGASP